MANDLLTIYGARKSESGKVLNITLVQGEGKDKKFFHTCVSFDIEKKTFATIDEATNYAMINVPILKPKKKAEPKKDAFEKADAMDDDLPF